MPLLPAGALPEAGQQPPGYSQGLERQVVILFADLRESTKIAEHRLPFDVVFILNQFFAELSASLKDTGGHYAQFSGDGLMAIYGLDVDLDRAAQMALAGAENMLDRLANLNDRLKMELKYPLRMGIGIHCVEAIVGQMGPPETPIISALGDTVNIAARLEEKTKEFQSPIVASATTVELAKLDTSKLERHDVEVRGRAEPIVVYALGNVD